MQLTLKILHLHTVRRATSEHLLLQLGLHM